jgi:hypothetical protein
MAFVRPSISRNFTLWNILEGNHSSIYINVMEENKL